MRLRFARKRIHAHEVRDHQTLLIEGNGRERTHLRDRQPLTKLLKDILRYTAFFARHPPPCVGQKGIVGHVARKNMEIRVSYEHSLASSPDQFIVQVPSQLVSDVPAGIPRALLPEYLTDLIIKRSPTIGKIRNLRIV
jgi:hypothetical protein